MKNKKSGKYKQRRKCGTKIRHHKNKVMRKAKKSKWNKKLKKAKKIREGKKSYESDERKI